MSAGSASLSVLLCRCWRTSSHSFLCTNALKTTKKLFFNWYELVSLHDAIAKVVRIRKSGMASPANFLLSEGSTSAQCHNSFFENVSCINCRIGIISSTSRVHNNVTTTSQNCIRCDMLGYAQCSYTNNNYVCIS